MHAKKSLTSQRDLDLVWPAQYSVKFTAEVFDQKILISHYRAMNSGKEETGEIKEQGFHDEKKRILTCDTGKTVCIQGVI